jgi:hypothetical protein
MTVVAWIVGVDLVQIKHLLSSITASILGVVLAPSAVDMKSLSMMALILEIAATLVGMLYLTLLPPDLMPYVLATLRFWPALNSDHEHLPLHR